MLQIKNLTITHRKDLRTILEDFQLSLNPGDKAVIIGEEGNGKSTLLKWIYNPEWIKEYTEAAGERICSGERLGYLPQELERDDYEKSIYEFFCEEPQFWECTPKQLSDLTGKLQLPVGYFYENQKMKTLSGGERIKVQLARILLAEPTILLLDEPSNDIDIQALEWLEKMINESKQAILYISHDETLIERTANVVIHIEQIRRKTISRYSISRMSYTEYINSRHAMMQNQERVALNDRREDKNRREKLHRIQQNVEHSMNAVSRQDPHAGQLLKKKMKAVKSMEKRYERESEAMAQLPESEDSIFIKFQDDIKVPAGKVVIDFSLEQLKSPEDSHETSRILAENITLYLRGGEKVCIIGKNGSGKTTLIKRIAEKLLPRDDLKVAYMPQNYEDALTLQKTPVDYLDETGKKEEITKIRTYLGSMKYTIDEMNRPISELSGGQKAKIFLLKMSLSGANVLILDEPTRNFSPLSNPVIRDVLSSYKGAIISISHDRKYMSEVCDTIYELTNDGLNKID